MKRIPSIRSARKGEAGYALVMIMFFLALLVLSTVVAAPTVISSIQREKEAEMVWRGRQYVRGIRMYYVKMHRFPTSLDDLTQPKTGLRFMRQAYKDPMNTTDGSWRLIYVGPNGQVIGSLNNQTLGTFGALGGLAATGVQPNASLGGTSSLAGASFGSTAFGTASGTGVATSTALANPTGAQAAGGSTTDTSSTDPNAQGGDSSDQMGTPQPLGMMDASNTIGGNIIGVGSKINKKSFLWYQKAKNYRQFEFIWDPSKDLTVGGASKGIGTPVQNPSGTNPAGTGTSNPSSSPGMNPGQNPQSNQNSPNPDVPLEAPPPSNP